MFKFINKNLLLLLSFISFSSVAGALYMQHVEHLEPCSLCIIQRYSFLIVGVLSLFAFFIKSKVKIIPLFLAIGFSLIGIFAAIKNIYAQYTQDITCGRDVIEEFVNGLFLAKEFPNIFYASGFCGAPIPPLFGISLPTWSLLVLLFTILSLVYSLIQGKNK